jgi:hypothetical protein
MKYNKPVLTVIILAIIALLAWAALREPSEDADRAPVVTTPTPTSGNSTTTPAASTSTPTQSNQTAGIKDLVSVTSPYIGQKVSSPLVVTGSARGTWYFEASFPVELKNAAGATLAQVPAQAQGEWMTTNFVPFKATLTFPAQPAGSKGTLILHKDNPSGDPARDQSVSIPVTF